MDPKSLTPKNELKQFLAAAYTYGKSWIDYVNAMHSYQINLDDDTLPPGTPPPNPPGIPPHKP